MQHLYTVVAGDTLRSIAQGFYGDENQWPRIFDENRDQLETGLFGQLRITVHGAVNTRRDAHYAIDGGSS